MTFRSPVEQKALNQSSFSTHFYIIVTFDLALIDQ
jgi:hypothetical protein